MKEKELTQLCQNVMNLLEVTCYDHDDQCAVEGLVNNRTVYNYIMDVADEMGISTYYVVQTVYYAMFFYGRDIKTNNCDLSTTYRELGTKFHLMEEERRNPFTNDSQSLLEEAKRLFGFNARARKTDRRQMAAIAEIAKKYDDIDDFFESPEFDNDILPYYRHNGL